MGRIPSKAKKPKADSQGWKDVEANQGPTIVAPPPSDPAWNDKPATKRVLTFGANGPESAQTIAPGPSTPTDVVLPTGMDAEGALKQIAALNAKVQTAHDAYTEAQARAKDKRETWNNLATQLQGLIKRLTSPAPMPLFDGAQRESDLARMEEAVKATTPEPIAEPPAVAQGETSEGSVTESDAPPVENVSTGSPEPSSEPEETVF